MTRRTRPALLALALLLSLVLAVPGHAQLRTADAIRAPAGVPDVSDLPLVEVPASRAGGGRTLAVFLTGDGGWAPLDREVAQTLAGRGVAVVGLNARAYLAKVRTPDETARDVGRVIAHYLAAWGKERVALVGYSRGADFVPFVANRLPAPLRGRVSMLGMLGPESTASFEFHLLDLVRDTDRPTDLPLLPEVERLRGMRIVCVYGSEEKRSLCRDADPGLVTKYERRGDHHFDRDYRALGVILADAIGA